MNIRERLAAERGVIYKAAKYRVALLKPSPYFLSMSSLGFQQIYKLFNACDDFTAQRCFLPDDPRETHLVCYESGQPASNMDIIAISIAYELEIPDLIRCFQHLGLKVLAKDRDINDPLVLIGGPLSYSNMDTLSLVGDCFILGEGEGAIEKFAEVYRRHPHKVPFLEAARTEFPELWVPAHQDREKPGSLWVNKDVLPAYSQILTPDTEFSNTFLIEAERGCHRRCTFCVMRREKTAGMRLVPADRVLSLVPDDVSKVGLVGAAVSDHPELLKMVRALVERGIQCSLSSLRTDKISEELIDLLAGSNMRTLTIAADGPTQPLRDALLKDVSAAQLVRAGEIARKRRMRVKMYVMIGLPGETDEDMDILAKFIREHFAGLSLSLGVSPFVSKRNTPLDNMPYAGIRVVEQRVKRLRSALHGCAEIRDVSAKGAFLEHFFAQGRPEAIFPAMEAVQNGGKFSAWKKALLHYGYPVV